MYLTVSVACRVSGNSLTALDWCDASKSASSPAESTHSSRASLSSLTDMEAARSVIVAGCLGPGVMLRGVWFPIGGGMPPSVAWATILQR